jgi:hypothetical protein
MLTVGISAKESARILYSALFRVSYLKFMNYMVVNKLNLEVTLKKLAGEAKGFFSAFAPTSVQRYDE